MIFVDSNVPMYLIGAPHQHKQDAQRLLEEAFAADEKLVTDVEVLQEILHRYTAIGRRDAIQPAFDAVHGLIDEIFAIDVADVERAKAIVLERRRLSARDAVHVAVMERRKITRIMSFDSGFDALPGVTRLAQGRSDARP
jgi:predicted nucleic acid-binding protein